MRTPDATLSDDAIFASLTDKQREVLELLAENRTSKEIAARLGVSDSAINQRIDPLRQRLGGVTRAELTRRYRSSVPHPSGAGSCEVFTGQNFQVETPAGDGHESVREDRPGRYRFEDSLSFAHEPPWSERSELKVVPRLLDGKHAALARGVTMLLMLLLIVSSLVLGLAAAQALTGTLGGSRPVAETS